MSLPRSHERSNALSAVVSPFRVNREIVDDAQTPRRYRMNMSKKRGLNLIERSRSPVAAIRAGEKSSSEPLESIEKTPSAKCDKIGYRTP